MLPKSRHRHPSARPTPEYPLQYSTIHCHLAVHRRRQSHTEWLYLYDRRTGLRRVIHAFILVACETLTLRSGTVDAGSGVSSMIEETRFGFTTEAVLRQPATLCMVVVLALGCADSSGPSNVVDRFMSLVEAEANPAEAYHITIGLRLDDFMAYSGTHGRTSPISLPPRRGGVPSTEYGGHAFMSVLDEHAGVVMGLFKSFFECDGKRFGSPAPSVLGGSPACAAMDPS